MNLNTVSAYSHARIYIYIYKEYARRAPCRLMRMRCDSVFFFAKAVIVRLVFASGIALWSANCANAHARPVLVDTSSCPDIADALNGNRTLDSAEKNVVQLHTPHSLVSGSNCVVGHIFLDFSTKWGITTSYERDIQNNRSKISRLWDKHKSPISPNQQLVVVTCDEASGEARDVAMSNSSDFDFILVEPRADTTLSTVECGKAFCMIRITTRACINSKYLQRAYPSTEANVLHMLHLQVSIMGAAASMMRLTAFVEGTPRVPETRVIMGVNSSAQYVGFLATCVNAAGMYCTLLEAMRFSADLATGIQVYSNQPDDAFFLENVQKIAGTDNEYIMNCAFFSSEFGQDALMRQYYSQNRRCPSGTHDTKLMDTFYGDSAIYKLECVACGINKYYSEVRTPARVVETTQTMYIFHNPDNPMDAVTNKRIPTRSYYVASHATLPEHFREQFRQDSSVPIGTTLVLKMSAGDSEYSPAAGSIVQRIECDGRDVVFTTGGTGTADYAVSFQVTAEVSGKLIRVHVADPECCSPTSANPNDAFSPAWKIVPALIFPQPANVQQGCVACPAGKFSGHSLAKNVSKCMDTRPAGVPVASTMERRSAAALGTAQAFQTFMEVNGGIVVVLEVRRIVPPALASSHFALEVWLDTRDLAAMQQSMPLIETFILHLYEPHRSDMSISGTTRSRLVSAQGPVILSLEGRYTDSGKDAGWGIVPAPRQHMLASRFSWFWVSIICSGAILLAVVIGVIHFLVPPYTTLPLAQTYRYGAV